MLSSAERLDRALAAYRRAQSSLYTNLDAVEVAGAERSQASGHPYDDVTWSRDSVRIEWNHHQGGVGSQVAVVDRREHWGVTVIGPVNLPRRQVVRVSDEGAHYHAEVVASYAVEDGFEMELAFPDGGRRLESRIIAGGFVKVERPGATSEEAMDGEVVNVSSDGVLLIGCDRIAVGETVRVIGDETVKLCRVRHCSDFNGLYRIGLQFLGV